LCRLINQKGSQHSSSRQLLYFHRIIIILVRHSLQMKLMANQ